MTLLPLGERNGHVRPAVEFKMLVRPLTEAHMRELVDIGFEPGRWRSADEGSERS
jgi:hypothetical protein